MSILRFITFYIHVQTHTYTHEKTHKKQTHNHMHKSTRTNAWLQTNTYKNVCTSTYTHIQILTPTQTHRCMHRQTETHTCIHIPTKRTVHTFVHFFISSHGILTEDQTFQKLPHPSLACMHMRAHIQTHAYRYTDRHKRVELERNDVR